MYMQTSSRNAADTFWTPTLLDTVRHDTCRRAQRHFATDTYLRLKNVLARLWLWVTSNNTGPLKPNGRHVFQIWETLARDSSWDLEASCRLARAHNNHETERFRRHLLDCCSTWTPSCLIRSEKTKESVSFVPHENGTPVTPTPKQTHFSTTLRQIASAAKQQEGLQQEKKECPTTERGSFKTLVFIENSRALVVAFTTLVRLSVLFNICDVSTQASGREQQLLTICQRNLRVCQIRCLHWWRLQKSKTVSDNCALATLM